MRKSLLKNIFVFCGSFRGRFLRKVLRKVFVEGTLEVKSERYVDLAEGSHRRCLWKVFRKVLRKGFADGFAEGSWKVFRRRIKKLFFRKIIVFFSCMLFSNTSTFL